MIDEDVDGGRVPPELLMEDPPGNALLDPIEPCGGPWVIDPGAAGCTSDEFWFVVGCRFAG